MAQRTGAERLLAPLAKTTAAGLCLAVVVAALALAGCGGGSSTAAQDPGSGAAAQSQSQAQAQGGGGPSAGKDAAGQGQGPTAAGRGAPGHPGSSRAPGQSAAPGQKHGPRIAAPKGPQEQAPSPKQVQEATVADISLTSPAIVAAGGHLGRLAATYTCDGDNTSPTLRWSGVPAGSAELALFVMNVQPVEERIFFDWALAGIDPGLGEIGAGKLPKGAVVGTNGFGEAAYGLCPPGPGETYMLALYALPRPLGLKRGFEPLRARQEVLDASGDVGLLPAVYERG